MNRPHPFGHHFLVGLQPSPTLTGHDRRLLQQLAPAGVILFGGNFEDDAPYARWLAALSRLLDDVRAAIGRPRIIVAMDHEGGRVLRPPAPITPFAYARRWAGRAAQVGHAMGLELRSLGVNLALAPVVDVDSNPANPVIGPRAFGTTAEQVIRAAVPFMHAVEAEGVLTCPKHFPGHGDTAVDSHRELPVVHRPRRELERSELPPFHAVVAAGARVLMTSHVLFPALDPGEPATLSRAITTGLLRERLGFSGVVVTDDVGMHAVSQRFLQGGAAAQTLLAGADLLDVCAFGLDTEVALDMADEIRDADLDAGLRTRSRARIERLLASLPQHPVTELAESVFVRHRALAPLHDAQAPGVGTWEQSVT